MTRLDKAAQHRVEGSGVLNVQPVIAVLKIFLQTVQNGWAGAPHSVSLESVQCSKLLPIKGILGVLISRGYHACSDIHIMCHSHKREVAIEGELRQRPYQDLYTIAQQQP